MNFKDKCYIMASWTSKSVKELQSFRGVAFSNYLKAGLVELIDIDPGGLVEDREEIISSKLTLARSAETLSLPTFLDNLH